MRWDWVRDTNDVQQPSLFTGGRDVAESSSSLRKEKEETKKKKEVKTCLHRYVGLVVGGVNVEVRGRRKTRSG